MQFSTSLRTRRGVQPRSLKAKDCAPTRRLLPLAAAFTTCLLLALAVPPTARAADITWNAAVQLQMESPVPAIRSGSQAVRDALFVVNETKDLAAWGGVGFLIWHSGYFSLCGWMVLFLMTAPRRTNVAGF